MIRKPDDQYPLFLSVNQAAEYMGAGKDFILREYYDKKMYGI